MEDFLHNTWQTAQEYWVVISMVVMTVLMAVFRTAKTNGKVDWLEAGMCGIFAYGIWFLLSFFNFPEGAGVLLGGMVGYKGTHFVSTWVGNRLGISLDSKK